MCLAENIIRTDLTSYQREELVHKRWQSKKYRSKRELSKRIGVTESWIGRLISSFEDRQKIMKQYKINKTDVNNRNIRNIGANPFDEKFDSVRTVAYQLSSVIHSLDLTNDRREENVRMNGVEVHELNWNPYVYDKDGNKQYYQRYFCWSLKDKQLLIESIYQKIDCGKILIRKHAWKKLEALAASGETELAFKDIVDGKQRMKTIQEFIFNEFPDMHGNYYADLSIEAQHRFTDHQLFSFAEMPESTTDEEVIYQFLKMNFTGVPQSQEHLDYVKEIGTKLN